MSDKKNIDRLFQEKFKDFEKLPEQHVWQNISKNLNGGQLAYKTPLWIYLLGSACVMSLIFMSYYMFKLNAFEGNNMRLNTEDSGILNHSNFQNLNAVAADEDALFKNKMNERSKKNSGERSPLTAKNTAGIDDKNKTEINSNHAVTKVTPGTADLNYIVDQHDLNGDQATVSNGKTTTAILDVNGKISKENTADVLNTDRATADLHVALGNKNEDSNKVNVIGASEINGSNDLTDSRKIASVNGTQKNGTEFNTLKNAVATEKSISMVSEKSTAMVVAQPENGKRLIGTDNGDTKKLENQFLKEAKAELIMGKQWKGSQQKKTESFVVAENLENDSEAYDRYFKELALAEKRNKQRLASRNSNEDDTEDVSYYKDFKDFQSNQLGIGSGETDLKVVAVEENENPIGLDDVKYQTKNKWEVGFQISPLFYNLNTKTSILDQRFDKNKTNSQVSMSYGVNAGYQITDKIAIHSGIHKLELENNTLDVAFYKEQNEGLAFVETNALGASYQLVSNLNNTYTTNNSNKGVLQQRINYIEVPVFIKYKIMENKINLNVTAGVSSMFLEKNKVALKSNEITMNIGEANNLKDFSFAANVGLGINYPLAKNLKASVEPQLKYQFSAIENAKQITPHFFGVYSGISYTF